MWMFQEPHLPNDANDAAAQAHTRNPFCKPNTPHAHSTPKHIQAHARAPYVLPAPNHTHPHPHIHAQKTPHRKAIASRWGAALLNLLSKRNYFCLKTLSSSA